MKSLLTLLILYLLLFCSCGKITYSTNGETIYRTGRNLKGEKLLDKHASRIKIVSSCQTCHGKNGDRMQNVSIKFSGLSDPEKNKIPYTDSLFYRFLDSDLKSDGSKANIGVIWKMDDADKKDLLFYLKSL